MTTSGKFIVIEGGEGSGKGTIISHLQKVLKDENVVFTREPGGTPLGEKLRTLIFSEKMCTMSELLLFEADRAEHMEQMIVPYLERGTHVICDRFDASTFAYQIFARWNKKHEKLFQVINKEVVGDTIPNLYLFCDILPKLALARRLGSGGEINRFDTEEVDFHERVYAGYQEFLQDKHHIKIDASKSIPEVTAAAETIIRRELSI